MAANISYIYILTYEYLTINFLKFKVYYFIIQ